MTDSERTDSLDAKHQHNREERIAEIKRWVRYIEDNPPEVWGEQLNDLVESQLQSARDSGLSAAQYERIKQAGDEWADSE